MFDTQRKETTASKAGAATDHFVYGPAGVLSQRDSAGGWEWPLADGLGSVRSVAGSANAVLETRAYDPYGQPLSSTGTPQTPFGFTGELADANGLLYLRARHYAPRLGAFPSLDPYEGSAARPMSLNGYSWVEGNIVNAVDPSGMWGEKPEDWDGCHMRKQVAGVPEALSQLMRELLRQSTIMIAMGDSGDNGYEGDQESCSAAWNVSGSLGTLTESGEMITHDHIIHSGAVGSIPFMTVATSPHEAAEYLRSWPCITLTGANSSIVIKGEDIKTSASRSVQGTLIIDAVQRDASGNEVSLLTLGRSAKSRPGWSPSRGERVWIAHMPGPNTMDRFLNHDVDFFDLAVDTSSGPVDRWGRMAYRTVTQWGLRWSERAEEGDSGGGVFTWDGTLIGANLEVVYGTYIVNQQFTVYFVPL